MTTLLQSLRENAPLIHPSQFIAMNPGCWVQYYDDTPAKEGRKSLSARTFDVETARRKQRDRCAVAFSLQAFGDSRTKEHILCFRTLGVDVDLLSSEERQRLPLATIDQRKEAYLRQYLQPFPLRSHWVTETRHGFHVLFRVQPQREPEMIARAEALNRRLVRRLNGDLHATLLTQVLRVPGTLQFKTAQPFLCRLLVDNADKIPPYALDEVERALRDGTDPSSIVLNPNPTPSPPTTMNSCRRWQWGLSGVGEGCRNSTATSLIGKLVSCLPKELWLVGFGGLQYWNLRNSAPLPEQELWSIYRSITRRERAKRQRFSSATVPSPVPARFPQQDILRSPFSSAAAHVDR